MTVYYRRFPQNFDADNYAVLRTRAGRAGAVAYVYGRTTARDGGEGTFVWRVGTATDNDGTILVGPTGSGGYWERVIDGKILRPEWWGAVGDDSTDDTVALQSTMDDAKLRGGWSVYLSRNYVITAPVVFYDEMEIYGNGYSTTVRVNAQTEAWLEELERDPTNANDPHAGDPAYFWQAKGMFSGHYRNNVTIEGIRFINDNSLGALGITYSPKCLYVDSCSSLRLRNCWFQDSPYEGCFFEGGGQSGDARTNGFIVTGCTFTNCGTNNSYNGLPALQMNGRDHVVSGNQFYDCAVCIGSTGWNQSITGNYLKGFTVVGIGTGDGAWINGGHSITGNTLIFDGASTRVGIGIGSSATGTPRASAVCGNTIFMDGTGATFGAYGQCIEISEGHATVSGNILQIVEAGWGIDIMASSVTAETVAYVKGNAIVYTDTTDLLYGLSCGIRANISEGSARVYCADNTVTGLPQTDVIGEALLVSSTGTLEYCVAGDTLDGGRFGLSEATTAGSNCFHNIAKHKKRPFYASNDDKPAANAICINAVGLSIGEKLRLSISSNRLDVSGAVASIRKRQTRIELAAESGVADDIYGIDNLVEGDIVILSPASGHTITVKESTGAGAQFKNKSGLDAVMASTNNRLMYEFDGTNLVEI